MIEDINKENKKFLILILSLLFVLFITFFVAMCCGRYYISIGNVFKFFFGQQIDTTAFNVIKNLRIPRTLTAIMIGAGLSVSGSIYQGVFNNKLTSPDLLGVSSGSSVGACLAILCGLGSAFISLFSFVFGFITVIITVFIAKLFNSRSNIVLILAGIAVGGLMSSLVGLMKYLADSDAKLSEMTFWLLGSLSKISINDFWFIMPVTVIGCTLAILFSWRLNIVSLGHKEAKSLGINYNVSVVILLLIATSLTAISVAFAGVVSWIGLVIPNIVRMIVGSNNKKVIPMSILIGVIFMVIVDTLARSISPNEIPISVITGILGTPLFMFVLFKRRRDLNE